MTQLEALTYLTKSGLRGRWDPEWNENPYGGESSLAGRIFNEGPTGLAWIETCSDGSGKQIEKWFDSEIYACPTPKRDGIALIGKSKEYGNPHGYGLLLNADGSLRWIVQPPIILSEPLSIPMRGRHGSEMRECVLRDHDKTYIHWNVVFPDPAFNWSEMRQYDPDTNRFTDKVVRTSRD